MPIWSLTKERVEKLLKQIGDKELEIDALIKQSKEDLWKKDLDEFINEWRFQLEDEEKRQRKVANMGRRISSKLKTQVTKGRKRKGDDTPSDSDFDTKRAKKAAVVKHVQPKSGLLSHLSQPTKPKQSALNTVSNGVKPLSQATVASASQPVNEVEKPEKDVWMTIDGADDSDVPIAPVFTKAKAAAEPKKAPAKAPPKAKPAVIESDPDDEPVVRPTVPVSRAPRAAARKPVKYSLNSDSDSDNGDDMLFDVGKMVKGIGPSVPTADAASTTRPLFSATTSLSRPGSSAGLVARKSMARTAIESGSEDETDYTRLAPAASGGMKATARATMLSDDDEDSDGFGTKPVAVVKSAAAAKPRAKAPAAKVAKLAQKAVPKLKEKEKAALSPAAKAYAAKQAKVNGIPASTTVKGKPKPKPKPKSTFDDSEEEEQDAEDEVEKMVEDILSDDEDEDDIVVHKPKAKAAPAASRGAREVSVAGSVASARPARRAAAEAVKKTWVLDEEDDDDDEEVSEEETGDFEDSE